MRRRDFWLLLAFLATLHFLGGGPGAVQTNGDVGAAFSPAVKRSSSAIAISADGDLLLVVNPDSDSLSIVELQPTPSVQEIAVGRDPRTVAVDDAGERAYVANRGSHSVSAIDMETGTVVAEIEVGARPYGVVVSPDGSRLFVAEQGNDGLNVVDTVALKSRQTFPLPDRPSGLALTDDGRMLFVTHILSNVITAITVEPFSVYLPSIRSFSEPGLASSRSTISGNYTGVMSATIPLWPDSNLVQSVVIAPDGRRAYVPHTRSNSRNQALGLDSTVFPLVSLIDLPGQKHLVGQQYNLEILDPPAVGLPFDAAFTPDGGEMWVLNAASNDITVVDVVNKQRIAHIEVGDNPRGIVISPDGETAYVNNTLAGTVSIIDTAVYTVTSVLTTTNIPLNATLLRGKMLFNSSDDPRMGRDQWMSCNTCHFDGEHDGQTWFLGFAGPRNTSSLLGMSETLPLRWSGEWDEAADSEFAIRMDSFGNGLLEGPMNCSLDPPDCVNHAPHAGRSEALDALAAYISSLEAPLSPNHIGGEGLGDAEERGQMLFHDADVGCAGCHPPPLYTDNLIHDVGTATPDERIGPAFNTPSLHGLYDSAPYFHDGSAVTLYDVLNRSSPGNEHDVTGLLTPAEIQELVAFLLALPFEP